MGIKSILELGKKEYEYPCLKISTKQDQLVFFTAESTGVVLASGTSSHSVGYYSESWGERFFVKYQGKVTLENEP